MHAGYVQYRARWTIVDKMIPTVRALYFFSYTVNPMIILTFSKLVYLKLKFFKFLLSAVLSREDYRALCCTFRCNVDFS